MQLARSVQRLAGRPGSSKVDRWECGSSVSIITDGALASSGQEGCGPLNEDDVKINPPISASTAASAAAAAQMWTVNPCPKHADRGPKMPRPGHTWSVSPEESREQRSTPNARKSLMREWADQGIQGPARRVVAKAGKGLRRWAPVRGHPQPAQIAQEPAITAACAVSSPRWMTMAMPAAAGTGSPKINLQGQGKDNLQPSGNRRRSQLASPLHSNEQQTSGGQGSGLASCGP